MSNVSHETEGLSTLHTVSRSPFERNSLESCLRVLRAESAVLLFEDGVYAAMRATALESKIVSASKKAKFYCLAPDLEARGLRSADVLPGVELVSYEGFVALAASHARVQAWL